jgi:hypothetical protein
MVPAARATECQSLKNPARREVGHDRSRATHDRPRIVATRAVSALLGGTRRDCQKLQNPAVCVNKVTPQLSRGFAGRGFDIARSPIPHSRA